MHSLKAPRQDWVDVSRGVGIILVVYGHILLGHFVSNPPAWVTAQTTLIYAFHMPLFFMLSGLFLWSSLGRDGFLASRVTQLIYPYLLWSLVTVTLEIALAPYVNSPLSVREALVIPFVPLEQFWFLYALLVCQMVVLIAYPRKWVILPLALLGSGVLALVGGEWIVIRSFQYLPYVALGVFGKNAFDQLSRASPRHQILVAGISWSIFAALWISGTHLILLLGASGSIGTVALAMLGAQSKAFAALGRASLAIYLLHTIFSAGTRIGLGWFGLSPTSIASVTISLIAGIVLPYTVWILAKRSNRLSVFGLGT